MSHKTRPKNVPKPVKDKVSQMKYILAQHPAERGYLIPFLQDIQDNFGYLPEEAIEQLGEATGISASEIYGVATFYTQFRFSPPGRHTIRVCQGTACHVRGGSEILDEVKRRLKIEAGETTADGSFDLQRVACLGCCALAPVVMIDDKVYAQMSVKKISSVLLEYKEKEAAE